ncbi:MAG: hydrolase [Asticcacaulis sp.]
MPESSPQSLDPRTTALVLIDLQKAIVPMPLQPRSGQEAAAAAMTLARRFRDAGALVVLVHVTWAKDYSDWPLVPVDSPPVRPQGGMPDDADHFVDGLQHPGDIVVTKHNWNAFFGTDLDLQLRRRGIKTVVLGGIATNFGVESTARTAYEQNYALIIAEDCCASASAELHDMAVKSIFPRIARVRLSADIRLA